MQSCLGNLYDQQVLQYLKYVTYLYRLQVSILDLRKAVSFNIVSRIPELDFYCVDGTCFFKKICRDSFRETCQWLKFPLNGLRAQSRVSPAVGLLPLASGPACLGQKESR